MDAGGVTGPFLCANLLLKTLGGASELRARATFEEGQMRKYHVCFVLAVAFALAGSAPAFAHKDMTDWLRMIEKVRQQQPNPQPLGNTRVVNSGPGMTGHSLHH